MDCKGLFCLHASVPTKSLRKTRAFAHCPLKSANVHVHCPLKHFTRGAKHRSLSELRVSIGDQYYKHSSQNFAHYRKMVIAYLKQVYINHAILSSPSTANRNREDFGNEKSS